MRYANEKTARAVAFIEALDDETILSAARSDPWRNESLGYQVILDRMGEDTNRLWITSRAAIVAYDRGLINETELDRIMEG